MSIASLGRPPRWCCGLPTVFLGGGHALNWPTGKPLPAARFRRSPVEFHVWYTLPVCFVARFWGRFRGLVLILPPFILLPTEEIPSPRLGGLVGSCGLSLLLFRKVESFSGKRSPGEISKSISSEIEGVFTPSIEIIFAFNKSDNDGCFFTTLFLGGSSSPPWNQSDPLPGVSPKVRPLDGVGFAGRGSCIGENGKYVQTGPVSRMIKRGEEGYIPFPAIKVLFFFTFFQCRLHNFKYLGMYNVNIYIIIIINHPPPTTPSSSVIIIFFFFLFLLLLSSSSLYSSSIFFYIFFFVLLKFLY
jgi:hypothetical protein